MLASRIRAVIAALALAMTAGPASTQDQSGAPAIDPKSPPWSAIGRVNRFGGEFCTGALIGPRHVLTVAHCLYDRERGQWVDAGDLQFVAGYHRGDFAAQALVNEIVVPPGFLPDRPLTGDNLANDWAILILNSAVGIRPLPWLPIPPGELAVRTGDRTALVRVGYSREQAHVMAAHANCTFVILGDRMLTHDCGVTLDDNGSPLLLRRNGQLSIVGVSVSVPGAGLGYLGAALPIQSFAASMNRILGTQ
ncbi:MAG: trypsin-like serine protease [Inquilinus sp.]|nr:trypsin-like serine protease [Inquilinus sp.]